MVASRGLQLLLSVTLSLDTVYQVLFSFVYFIQYEYLIGVFLLRVPLFFYQLAGGVTLEHRIKEPYSMWKKMERQGGGVDSVYDAVALRVVIKAKREPGETDKAHEEKSRQLCYHVRSE